MSAPALHPTARVTEACRLECAAIAPADPTTEWEQLVAGMSDAQLARTVDRLEALPGGEFRRIACAEFDRRAHAELLAATAPPTRWTATPGGNR